MDFFQDKIRGTDYDSLFQIGDFSVPLLTIQLCLFLVLVRVGPGERQSITIKFHKHTVAICNCTLQLRLPEFSAFHQIKRIYGARVYRTRERAHQSCIIAHLIHIVETPPTLQMEDLKLRASSHPGVKIAWAPRRKMSSDMVSPGESCLPNLYHDFTIKAPELTQIGLDGSTSWLDILR